MSKNPVCIRRTTTVEEAAIVVTWLEEQGIEATVFDPGNPGVMAFGVTDAEGIEVCVGDGETAERAMTMLAEHDRKTEMGEGPSSSRTIEVKCEKCGTTSSFGGDQSGTVQSCSRCGGYLDIPS